jgi:hypothetical protein
MLDTLTVPAPVKIGGAEFPIRLVVDEDIKHTDQDGVSDCDNRTLLVVSLQPAGKYKRPAWRPSQEQKGLDERALMASQWPSHP